MCIFFFDGTKFLSECFGPTKAYVHTIIWVNSEPGGAGCRYVPSLSSIQAQEKWCL